MGREPGRGIPADDGGGAHTRRQLIAAGALGGAAGVLGPAVVGSVARGDAATKPCVPDVPGVATGAIAASPDGRRVWSADVRAATITAHSTRTLHRGRALDVHGAPVGLALTPDGATALVTTASFDRPGLRIVDLRSRTIDRVDVGPRPGAVAVSAGGRRAYVAGGGAHGTLTRVDIAGGRVHAPLALGAEPRGLALDPAGAFALVALNGAAQIAVVDLRRGRVTRRIATAPYPAQIALSPDGRRALVTHNGFGARAVTLLDLHAHTVAARIRVGADPAGVAFSRSGASALVTAAGAGTVTVLDGRSGRRRRTVRCGGSPRAVTVSGTRGLVADARTGLLSAVRLGAGA